MQTMARTYSTYEAKTHFSEILRKVRGGESVLVSYHGKTVAEIRPVEEEQTLAGRVERLEAQGAMTPAKGGSREALKPVARRPGALQRFLGSRD